jgi:hypothetical protein
MSCCLNISVYSCLSGCSISQEKVHDLNSVPSQMLCTSLEHFFSCDTSDVHKFPFICLHNIKYVECRKLFFNIHFVSLPPLALSNRSSHTTNALPQSYTTAKRCIYHSEFRIQFPTAEFKKHTRP